MKQPSQIKGFTLIELLIVIAIIGILAVMLQPAVFKALTQGKKVAAQSEIKSIEAAVKAYLNEYSKFPHRSATPANDYTYGAASTTPPGNDRNRALMNVLRSVNGPGNLNFTNNPRKIVFLDISERSLDSDGNYLDPWQAQYEITVDTGYDNNCDNMSGGYGTVSNRNVAVWSRGADGKENTADDIRSWK